MITIIINKQQEKKQIALIVDGILTEYYEEDFNETRKEGNIYIGIVKDIIIGMQSAFVDIGGEKNSFIHLKDIMPKIDETKEVIDNNINIKKVIKKQGIMKYQVAKLKKEKQQSKQL